MTNTRRPKRILRRLTIKEISGVDKAAQVPAEALLMKRATREQAMNDLSKIADAERVVTKGAVPSYTRQQYEEEMLDLAKREASVGESTACAFARLCDERNPQIEALFKAAEQAEVRRSDREERELITKHREEMWPLLVKAARSHARVGETVEQALDRLLCTDPLFKRVYANTFAG